MPDESIFDADPVVQEAVEEFIEVSEDEFVFVDPFEGTPLEGETPPRRVSSDSARRAYLGLEVPEGFHIHHLCGNPWCRNRDHLIAVSADDHRKIHGRRSYCER